MMNNDIMDAMKFDALFKVELDMLTSDAIICKEYELLNANHIATHIFTKPRERVVFALYYETDETGTVIMNRIDGWFSISLQYNHNDRGMFLLVVSKTGERVGVDVGEQRVGATPTFAQVLEAVNWVFDGFGIAQEFYCVVPLSQQE